MSTAFAGVHSDPPTVKIEPIKDKSGDAVLDKDGNHQYDVPMDVIRNIIEDNTIDNPEAARYVKCWESDVYRNWSPGEDLVPEFLELANPNKGVTVIDWGCGTGRAAKKLYEDKRELDITAVDFAYNALDPDVKKLTKDNDRFRFVEHDLTKPSDLQSLFGICTDVLEHIPEEDIDKALTHILWSSKNVFFQIATAHDIFSEHPDVDVDGPLHLTVKDYHWWLKKFSEQSVYVNYSKNLQDNANPSVIFYVTGWGSNALCWDGGYVNTDEEIIKNNIAENAKLGIQPIKPHSSAGETEVMLLCGGPSLNEFEDEIREKRKAGVKCITVNGTYNWCIERNIKPSLQCMIDARPFMLRMVEQVDGMTDETKYVISSQCDPEIFSWLPHERTYMWQVSLSEELVEHITEHFGPIYKNWWPSPGGSTVGLRALLLLRMLGFNKIYIYGMDSCVMESDDDTLYQHHAYPQPEDDYRMERGTIPIVIGENTKYAKTFQLEPWQAFQMREFELMVPQMADDVQLQIKGPGVIAYMIEVAAKLHEDQIEKGTVRHSER